MTKSLPTSESCLTGSIDGTVRRSHCSAASIDTALIFSASNIEVEENDDDGSCVRSDIIGWIDDIPSSVTFSTANLIDLGLIAAKNKRVLIRLKWLWKPLLSTSDFIWTRTKDFESFGIFNITLFCCNRLLFCRNCR